MKSQTDVAFPIPKWQNIQNNIKGFTKERIDKLKSTHKREEEALNKIVLCEAHSKDIRCWHHCDPRAQKHYFKFLSSYF